MTLSVLKISLLVSTSKNRTQYQPVSIIIKKKYICLLIRKIIKKCLKVLPVIEMAERKIRAEKILPEYLNISWAKYDDECDAAIATISAIDAYAKNCSHFILGPSCEYSVGE